jgi:hypothetical protein
VSLRAAAPLGAALAGLLTLGCYTMRMETTTLYASRHMKVKLIHNYEYYPFVQIGDDYHIDCGARTIAWLHDGEWKDVARLRSRFHPLDDHTLYWTDLGVNVTFDGCLTLDQWFPSRIPEALVERVAPSQECVNPDEHHVEWCRLEDFRGARAPRYEDVQFDPRTHAISFRVLSTALRRPLRVRKPDAASAWSVTGEVAP